MKPRIIKRYSNRKLYDTSVRHYVTLADVAQTVRAGEDVRVDDYVTGADITAQILIQVLFEEEKRSPRYPASGITRVIRTGLAA